MEEALDGHNQKSNVMAICLKPENENTSSAVLNANLVPDIC